MVTDMAVHVIGLGSAIAAAESLAAIHVIAEDGRCAWCWDEFGIWTPHPCTARKWADRARANVEHTGRAHT